MLKNMINLKVAAVGQCRYSASVAVSRYDLFKSLLGSMLEVLVATAHCTAHTQVLVQAQITDKFHQDFSSPWRTFYPDIWSYWWRYARECE